MSKNQNKVKKLNQKTWTQILLQKLKKKIFSTNNK
jgi:hypothetical protein